MNATEDGSKLTLDFQNSCKRDRIFDLLKLYAMLSVVLDHSLQHMIGGSIQSTQLYNWIFISQMPIFMFVAGYFALNGVDKNYSFFEYCQRIGKTVTSLLIPFVSYSIIVSIFSHVNKVALSFLYPDYSLWFLWALMWMQIIMITAQQVSRIIIKNSHVVKVVLGLVLYLIGLIPFGLLYICYPRMFQSKLIIFYSLFYLSGYIYSVLQKRYSLLSRDMFKIVSIIITVLIVAIVMIKHPTILNDKETIRNIIIRCIGSISAVILMLHLSSYAKKLKWVRLISAFGVLSLEMYYTHLLLLKLSFFNKSVATPGVFIVKYVLLVVSSLILIIILKRCWITDFLLFGKLPNRKTINHA